MNIVTVEDPIEYEIKGVAQVEVDAADKVTFVKALRSVLRHDPDVVMIGEIRDAETADVAIKASLTGHLVFSTLHTNSAASVITRLADMGVDRFLIAATLRLAVAQRLVRQLCPRCRKPRELTVAEAVGPQSAGNRRACGVRAGRLHLLRRPWLYRPHRPVRNAAAGRGMVAAHLPRGGRSGADSAHARKQRGHADPGRRGQGALGRDIG